MSAELQDPHKALDAAIRMVRKAEGLIRTSKEVPMSAGVPIAKLLEESKVLMCAVSCVMRQAKRAKG